MARSRLADQVGRVVGGRYRLLAPIGAGASADVYVADDVNLRRRVAIKILRDALAADEGFLRRFRAEARAVASLRHPNIVTVYDWGEEETGPFLVLEYLGGGSLRDLLDRGHHLTASQAALVGLEAARGLDYAHRRGLVHRDIKPANLLFDDEGRLAIADFGIARALAEATWTEPAGAVVGTVRYASPEQARGQSVDGRADVYALALVLVEATTGAVPFAADTTLATLMARLDRVIPTTPALGPLAAVIEACGAVDPSDRLDAAGLTRALDRAAHDLPSPGRLPLAVVPQLFVPHDELDSTTVFGALPDTGASAPAGAPIAPPTPPVAEIDAPADPPGRGGRRRTSRRERGGSRRDRGASRRKTDHRRRRPFVVAAIAVVAVAAAAGAVVLPPVLFPTYAVPSLVGLSLSDATSRAGPHFRVSVRHERITGARVGVVLAQAPTPTTHHRPGPVTVEVSDGNAFVTVPDLTGLPLAAAVTALQGAGLRPEQSAPAFSDTVRSGTVIRWSPQGRAAVGDAIQIVVSEGAELVTMPDLVTNPVTADQAAAQLQQLAILPSAITQTQDFSDTVPSGDVIATTPAAGQPADRAGTVTLDVSKGPDVVPVPDVRGRRVAVAEATLKQAGFVPQTYGPPGASIVVDQQPLPGTSAKRGSTVLLDAF